MFYSSEKCLDYLKSFYEYKNFSDIIACFSAEVWEKMEFSACASPLISKVSETELTNCLVREIAMLITRKNLNLPVRVFHSIKESTNGSDIEIIVRINETEHLIFACQAKRLYVNESQDDIADAIYTSIWHEVGKEKKNQIELLLEYAEKKHAFPLYMLYNYTDKEIQGNLHDEALYGCTLVSAHYLYEEYFNKGKKKVKFSDIHGLNKPAKPFVSLMNIKDVNALSNYFGSLSSYSGRIKRYLIRELVLQDDWIELFPNHSTDTRFAGALTFEDILTEKQQNQNLSLSFSPKFRIILNL